MRKLILAAVLATAIVQCQQKNPVQPIAGHTNLTLPDLHLAQDQNWRTYWQSPKSSYPHETILDMESSQTVHGFVYLPPAYSASGRIKDYECYLSSDGHSWGEAVSHGRFNTVVSTYWPDENEKINRILFAAPHQGRYLKLVTLSSIENDNLTAMAEFHPITNPENYPYKDETFARLKGTRYAPSIHLGYPAPESRYFYAEMTIDSSVTGSYFMCAGFRRGYFGLQEREHDKVVIFSVWDTYLGDNPDAVPEDVQVQISQAGDDVRVQRFGNEGTGAQSFYTHNWTPGETYRFFLKAVPNGDWTSYTAYFYLNRETRWKELVTFSTLASGEALNGLYSFVEDFQRDFDSFNQVRKARFSNIWVGSEEGRWTPLSRARFTRDSNPNTNVDGGAQTDGFFLKNGGHTANVTCAIGAYQETDVSTWVLPNLDTVID